MIPGRPRAWQVTRACLLAGSALALAGCTSEPVQLLDHGLWRTLDADHPLAGEPCSDLAATVEDGALEMQTDGCAPVAVGQTLSKPIEVGDTLEIVWWHDNLLAAEPAEGTFSLHLDGAELYARTHPIPGPAQITTETFEAGVGGGELVVRVENHGSNTWNLLRLTRL